MVQASRDEACLAVDMYNPDAPRSYEAFVVHVHLAGLYVLQAEANRAGIDYRYIEMRGRARRIGRVDGEPKTWELERHVNERWAAVKWLSALLEDDFAHPVGCPPGALLLPLIEQADREAL
jgi:hypothetical protein